MLPYFDLRKQINDVCMYVLPKPFTVNDVYSKEILGNFKLVPVYSYFFFCIKKLLLNREANFFPFYMIE